MKVLVATEKPFAKKAFDAILEVVEGAGYELALLEKYTAKAELLEAVKDADALIVRSDKVTAEVIAAAEQLKIVPTLSPATASERAIRPTLPFASSTILPSTFTFEIVPTTFSPKRGVVKPLIV